MAYCRASQHGAEWSPVDLLCAAAEGARARPAHECGSLVLGHAVSMVSIDPQGHHDHPAGDPCALAPGRLPAILAVEIPLPWRATARVRFNWHAQRGPLSTK